jgi:hypothetical protein
MALSFYLFGFGPRSLDDSMIAAQMEAMTEKRSLDDPEIAAAAWGRFRRLMRWMAFWGALCVLLVLGWLYWQGAPMRLSLILATTGGVWCSFMLGTGLMSLMFLSSGTGHDAEIDERFKEGLRPDDD